MIFEIEPRYCLSVEIFFYAGTQKDAYSMPESGATNLYVLNIDSCNYLRMFDTL